MRSTTKRLAATVIAEGVGVGLGGGVAAAAPEGGKHDGPVRYWADGKDDCSVDFTIENDTALENFTIDFVVDDEVPTGTDYGTGPTGRLAGLKSVPNGTVTHNVRLGTVEQLPTLPNPLADSHVVKYRMILGPEQDYMDIGTWHQTTIRGCNPITSGSAGL
ncbi:hypothetical protein [Rhodococcus sp. AH-ZY2]|uniref:hypothetical protein n=1 Tax=Rhodococcus sp. AH-ZY2 TaxID=3047468 RepID=UPI0027E13E29|nr:hypothetical protein [Rhodococcus sp. AH-ZY2]WML61263.1 hypothetical protein QNA09_15410 [Rhodococcus sp. AH-ZY2]